MGADSVHHMFLGRSVVCRGSVPLNQARLLFSRIQEGVSGGEGHWCRTARCKVKGARVDPRWRFALVSPIQEISL
jgi:hypothetical protein